MIPTASRTISPRRARAARRGRRRRAAAESKSGELFASSPLERKHWAPATAGVRVSDTHGSLDCGLLLRDELLEALQCGIQLARRVGAAIREHLFREVAIRLEHV